MADLLDSGCYEGPIGIPRVTMAGDFVVKSGWSLGPRELSEYELVYFPTSSRTLYSVHGVSHILDKPCYVFTRPGERHHYVFDPSQSIRHLFIHFTLDSQSGLLTEDSSLLRQIPPLTLHATTIIIPVLLKHILHLANSKPHFWRERCSQLCFAALAELAGLAAMNRAGLGDEMETIPYKIVQALRYIDDNLDGNLSIQEISKFVGWTHEYFTRMFHQYIGKSPRTFILERRIDRACQLLMQQQHTIKEIAYMVGFRDEHYFSRAFVKQKGITATDYREKFGDPRMRHLAPANEYSASYPVNQYLYVSK
ncbi:AraC family transcriptional regulator [Alicyclobacillus herbarius]|uniref:AraC family transcriptional regulator n=1 Tax=Alicyclobacillus herbarius TaxID=122960 RepID=UPI000411B9B4|nr:AraC family transcriptional regulator [Alicyclobacillus herbarius]